MTNSQLWFRGIRPSKFRHIYGLPTRKECCYISMQSGNDGNLCAVNPIFVAIVADIAFVVIPINNTGRIDFQCCKVIGHVGQVLDLKWNPFNDQQIASASDDCSIKIWNIPEGGLTSNLTEYSLELTGHKRKVTNIEWHPTASNVLISAGFDHLIIVWDTSLDANHENNILNIISCHTDMIYSMAINRDGSLIATTSKDKILRIIEPRSGITVSEGSCHTGTKATRVVFLDNNRVLTTGFSKNSDRQYAIWNQHDLKKPLMMDMIDSSSGILQPFFDYDTKVLYLAGKGDGNIRYYEIVDDTPYIHYLNQFLSGHPQKALGFMPKRGLNVGTCEVFRFYKLHATGNICEPIQMIVPRKSTLFQQDLYPDALASIAATTAKEWLMGRNVQPILMSLQTGHSVLDVPNKKLCNGMIQHKENDLSNGITNNGNDNNDEIRCRKYSDRSDKSDKGTSDNISRKFAFLAQQTIPDYRTQTDKINDKNLKTTTNQTTKFHKLQSIFGQQHPQNTPKDINNIQNNNIIITNGTNHINTSNNNSMENINLIHAENELKKIILRQVDEIKNLKNQLKTSDKRILDLESEVKRLSLTN